MIFDLAQDVAADLASRKFPVEVRYGREPVLSRGYGSHTVTFSRDDQSGDGTPESPRGSKRNPDYRYTRGLGVVALLFIASGLPGAMQHEHERECDLVVDGLLTAIEDWAKEAMSAIEWGHLGYLAPDQVDGTEHRAAIVYEVRFQVLRGVYRKDYDGGYPATAELSSATTETRVLLPDDTYEVVP